MATTVKEILCTAAELIGRGDLAREAEKGSSSSEELSLLLRCYNLVENEVALDYFPLKKQETVNTRTGKIYYTELSQTPVSVIKAEMKGGEIGFKLYPDYIEVSVSGDVAVTYVYAPAAKQLAGNAECDARVAARVLAYGAAAEFLVGCGRFTEAAVFDKKYRDALRAAGSVRRTLSVHARRWA